MRAAKHLNGSVHRFLMASKTTLLSTLVYIGVTSGLALVPQSGFAALQTPLCPMERFANTANVCTSGDINFATALVASVAQGGCIPGETVSVSLSANLELNGNNTRFDPAIFVSEDGSPIDQTIANGGPASCEVMPLQGDHFSDPPMPVLAITDNNPPSDGDICSDTIGGGG
ncbi:MAG: hypothetical protein R3212_06160, partial [Xanthomonadales bacterium]|nr:hypothetical protein [Xanthomonadales bacterium]